VDVEKTKQIFQQILNEIEASPGVAALDRFADLRAVDAKVRDVKIIVRDVEGIPPSLLDAFDNDQDFKAMSRRVRLETLAHYIRSTLRFLDTGVYREAEQKILPPPAFGSLVAAMPNLDGILSGRWEEAQRCIHAHCNLAAVIMMGSILEAILLARAMLTPTEACRAGSAPKDKEGRVRQITDWRLAAFIDVAVELGWLKLDRAKFSHILRESRNLVHPYEQARLALFPDSGTCDTCWSVINSAVDDIIKSVPSLAG
jgi:hypothetical protein